MKVFFFFFNVELGIQLTETQTWRDISISMPTVALLQPPNLWIERPMLFTISQFSQWRAVSCKVYYSIRMGDIESGDWVVTRLYFLLELYDMLIRIKQNLENP